jgi:biopolymer transport protein ExbB/TolQ
MLIYKMVATIRQKREGEEYSRTTNMPREFARGYEMANQMIRTHREPQEAATQMANDLRTRIRQEQPGPNKEYMEGQRMAAMDYNERTIRQRSFGSTEMQPGGSGI